MTFVSSNTGSISGVYFNDFDADGIRDTGETGFGNREIFLDTNGNGLTDAGEIKVLTAADGSFKFSNLPAGTHKVRRVVPTGWRLSTALADVSLTAGQNLAGVLVGVTQKTVTPPPPPPTVKGSIGGYLFLDTNKNGKRDTNESYLSGKVVFIDLDGDNVLDSVEKRLTTDSQGKFNFTGLSAGTHKIRRVVPSGYKVTTPARNITLSAGQIVTGVTIGTALA